MHYRNGREAKNGDPIVQLGYDSGQVQAVGSLRDARSELVMALLMRDPVLLADVASWPLVKDSVVDGEPA